MDDQLLELLGENTAVRVSALAAVKTMPPSFPGALKTKYDESWTKWLGFCAETKLSVLEGDKTSRTEYEWWGAARRARENMAWSVGPVLVKWVADQRWIDFPSTASLLAVPWPTTADHAGQQETNTQAMIAFVRQHKFWEMESRAIADSDRWQWQLTNDAQGETSWNRVVSLVTDYSMAEFLMRLLFFFAKSLLPSDYDLQAGVYLQIAQEQGKKILE